MLSLICGDFKLPECASGSIDDDRADLEEYRMEQYVRACIHVDVTCGSRNLLDLVIPQDSSDLLAPSTIVSSHHLSDHHHIVCDLNIEIKKLSPPSRLKRNIRAINKHTCKQRILKSILYTVPGPTAEKFAMQLQSVVMGLLVEVAPLHSTCSPRSTSAMWLSPEDHQAKKNRCQLQRRWKWKQIGARPHRLPVWVHES